MARDYFQKKNFILKPASQITANPPTAISIAVPKSGCDATKKTGITRTKKGKTICFMSETCSNGILL